MCYLVYCNTHLHTSRRLESCARSQVQVDGQPFCNSHYTRQLWIWTTILALTRQKWDAASRSLTLTLSGPLADLSPFSGVGREGEGEGAGAAATVAGSVLPVVISGAFLHWHPHAQQLACAAGTMLVRHVAVLQDGRGNRVLSECLGEWEVPAGGALLLENCQLGPAVSPGSKGLGDMD